MLLTLRPDTHLSLLCSKNMHKKNDCTAQSLYNPVFGVHRNEPCYKKGHFLQINGVKNGTILQRNYRKMTHFPYNSSVKFYVRQYNHVISKSVLINGLHCIPCKNEPFCIIQGI